ncbi:fungal pheromone STE3G-protein-coupled receptor [Peniophora sp. CONT]|nr:fungal pheromone STE3G-protein-coupled receptor [Peniophora sp. CONT]
MAVDPTYPLFPIASILSSVTLLLVLMTSFIRQSWNLGVIFLCFWLFWENITNAASSIIWSDNADLKLYVYCDITSHLQIFGYVLRPMATLIITRRLYLIASLQSVAPPSKIARRWDIAIEWTLGLIVPLLVAGPLYFINQTARFTIREGLGCSTATEISVFATLSLSVWNVTLPLISIIFYYPRIMYTYYRQSQDINSFLSSNRSISRTNYFRILALASVDVLFTLPIGIVDLTLSMVASVAPPNWFPFFPGWSSIHYRWDPVSVPYWERQVAGTASLADDYIAIWTPTILAFVIFGLFGLTSEARASYWRVIFRVGSWLGWKPTLRNGRAESLGNIEFGGRPQDASEFDLEIG